MRFVSLLRPSPLLFSLSLSPSSIEGERARDSFNNPAARSEIYYFRATLLDKSIRLMLILSLSLLLSIRPFVSLQHQPRLSPFLLFSFSPSFRRSSFFSFFATASAVRPFANFCTGWPNKERPFESARVDSFARDSSSCRGGGWDDRSRGKEKVVEK